MTTRRAFGSGPLNPLTFFDAPEKLCAQKQVEYHHLDICAPRWPQGQAPRIYMYSREAIAVWLSSPDQEPSVPSTPISEISTELFSELNALLAAGDVALGNQATEDISYICGMLTKDS
jgi:hypothetical protein